MKNILLLTPIYPAEDLPKTYTPVVHYFAREWVKLGYRVVVIHYIVNFPKVIYSLTAPFQHHIASTTGTTIRTKQAGEIEYEIEGIQVKRIPLLKYFPHTRYKSKEIESAYQKTIKYLSSIDFKPDCVLGHWLNPQLELIGLLKEYYSVPSSLVLHDEGVDLKNIFKKDADELMAKIDVLGFRSDAIKRNFEKNFPYKKKCFYCYSGIPETYTNQNSIQRNFEEVNSFIFVGTLFKRKYPAEIIYALENVYKGSNTEYSLTYVGRGSEEKRIDRIRKKIGKERNIHLLGRVDRNEVQQILSKNDIFIMISKAEAFGLVYLEAMSAGCITIASRNEGFDGIIQDGINGFLCEPGNYKELSTIISKIQALDSVELTQISEAAIRTAYELTDKKAASSYMQSLENLFTTIL